MVILTFLGIKKQISIIIYTIYYCEEKRKSQGKKRNFFTA